ncbi:MAG TPA: hypothetical protein VNM14_16915 [Planctomycetota bacterium]|nr:hypothetical protein [Planctomycetota bacterium]
MRKISALFLAMVALAEGRQDNSQVDVELRNDSFTIPADLMIRARVTAITPSEPTTIHWRWGGEGLGGTPTSGVFGENLAVGTWSPALPVASLAKGKFPGKLFLTVTVGRGGKRVRDAAARGLDGPARSEGQSTDVEVEFEFTWQGKPIKTFTERGPDGGTVGLVIPAQRLAGGKTPANPEFLEELSGLLDYARRRSAKLEAIAAGPRPSKFSIVTNCGGYGMGHGYAVRYTNKAVFEAELKGLKALGVNGLAGGSANPFSHVIYAQLGGYPVPSAKKGQEVPEAGCPFAPGVAARSKAMIDEGLAAALRMPVDEVWWRTEDEIGSVVDRAPEGKGHFARCAACGQAFRAWLKSRGVTPAALGRKDWDEVQPADLGVKGEPPTPLLYYTAMFANYASAKLFTPLRDAIATANDETRKNPSLKRPLVYSFALRGNTFLMGGHSLDFFDFYRHADNAMVYETSNRDARVWEWDSLLCDVGRVLSSTQKTEFGVYVKPHRGAPIQRALSAASRGAKLIYWYTFGPDYVKGDSFAESEPALEATARAAGILGRAEDLLYGSAWAASPEIAVVNPRSSELWNRFAGSPAPYENAKWIYAALAHAHLPVDPIDEGMLETADLSRYKVIYVSGTHLTSAAAATLAAWVQAGGVLYTSGGGLQHDETNGPLTALAPLLGLEGRGPVELWSKVQPYGATALELYAGSGPEISGSLGTFVPVVGREPLKPAAGTELLAKFADGGAALTRRLAGKGQVWVAGFFPGLEYSAGVRREDFDMARDFDAARRSFVTAAALERVKPVVDASAPLVEGLLLRNGANGTRAVTLMNWGYRVKGPVGKKTQKELIPLKDVTVTLRITGDVSKATSTVLQKPLAVQKTADGIRILLPELLEGDVLRLE